MNKAERLEILRRADLYPVISSEFTNGRPVLDVLKAVADAGCLIVQMREKNKSKRELFHLAEKYLETTSKYGMLLIVNDHVDVALAAGADGVHLGQDDLPLTAGRAIAPELVLGVSTHDQAEADKAQAEGADYINIGPLFPTKTKELSYEFLGVEALRTIAPSLRIPFSVMGGIKEKHIPGLLDAGARMIAMVTEITQADDVLAKTKQLRSLFKK